MKVQRHTKGFTLVATLLLLMLLSGIAIGLMMMVNTEGKVGGTDLQNNLAFHAAEGGVEKMYSDLSTTLQTAQVPTLSDICSVNSLAPSIPGVNFNLYQVQASGKIVSGGTTTQVNCNSSTSQQQLAYANANWGNINSGPNQGLYASVIPINMTVTASMMGGQQASMYRQAQIALIPVFQFGMFCDADCSIYPGSNMTFAGPVHANGDFYPLVNTGATLTFESKIAAYGNIIRTQLANTNTAISDRDGIVYVPTSANGGCATTTSNCTQMASIANYYGDGSVTGGGSPTAQPSGNINSNWNSFSTGANTGAAPHNGTNGEVINGNYYKVGATTPAGTGATKLSLPFVNGSNFPYEIIRRPPPASGNVQDDSGESPTSALGSSREYNMAQIRVLLSDDPAEFENGTGAGDSQNVRLANVTQNTGAAATQYGVTLPAANVGSEFTAGSYNLYFATGSNALLGQCINPGGSTTFNCPPDWPYPPAPWTAALAANASSPVPLLYSNTTVAAPYLTAGSIPTLTSGVVTTPSQPGYYLCPTSAPLGHAPYASSYPSAYCPTTPAAPYWYYWNGTSAVAVTSQVNAQTNQTASWNLLDGWLRVEYLNNSGTWVPVTNEWLQLGFARGVTAPTANKAGLPAGGVSNPVNPKAILILQQPADRASTAGSIPAAPTTTAAAKTLMINPAWTTWGLPSCTGTHGTAPIYCSSWTAMPPPAAQDPNTGYWQFGPSATPTVQSPSQYNWYPINFYDAREGEPRDIDWSGAYGATDNSCTTNGVMNAVEIDVGNLQQWLLGNIGTSGGSVNSSNQNGYILYFSDRRGMLPSPNAVSSHPANSKTGDSGLEDTINSASVNGIPDGAKETKMTGQNFSPEDDNQNGALDNWGAYSLGLGFYGSGSAPTKNLNTLITGSAHPNPFGSDTAGDNNNRIQSCATTGRKNWVSGARHVLKLVDGALGNLPLNPNPITLTNPDGTTSTYNGGFTVASENPVYIQGNYNSAAPPTDSVWTGGGDKAGMAAAAVIADTVTILSNSWDDRVSMAGTAGNSSPTNLGNRTPTSTYYRLAIAAGKNMTFTYPTTAWPGLASDSGTDGGIHNFLHLIENWGSGGVTENYMGSLASMYYSTYDTGFFKCCTAVYGVPTRNFSFDLDFRSPYALPPGTPMFKDVESLGYRQLFSPRTQ